MVDAVSIVSVQGAALRLGSQGGSASAVPPPPAPPADEGVVSSHIRIDNLQNVAILEYVSTKTGEVVRQYPSQAQINAFKRAESLQSPPATETKTIDVETGNGDAAPATAPQAAPTPLVPPQIATPAPVIVPSVAESSAAGTTSVLV